MDLLIKNNIMKRNKIIVDVGTHTTKILDVHYASKEIYIKEAKNFESNFVIVENGIDYDELARKVDMFTSGNGRRDNFRRHLPQTDTRSSPRLRPASSPKRQTPRWR